MTGELVRVQTLSSMQITPITNLWWNLQMKELSSSKSMIWQAMKWELKWCMRWNSLGEDRLRTSSGVTMMKIFISSAIKLIHSQSVFTILTWIRLSLRHSIVAHISLNKLVIIQMTTQVTLSILKARMELKSLSQSSEKRVFYHL